MGAHVLVLTNFNKFFEVEYDALAIRGKVVLNQEGRTTTIFIRV